MAEIEITNEADVYYHDTRNTVHITFYKWAKVVGSSSVGEIASRHSETLTVEAASYLKDMLEAAIAEAQVNA